LLLETFTKKVRDSELLARIHSGFRTFALRRSLKEVRATLPSFGGQGRLTRSVSSHYEPTQVSIRVSGTMHARPF